MITEMFFNHEIFCSFDHTNFFFCLNILKTMYKLVESNFLEVDSFKFVQFNLKISKICNSIDLKNKKMLEKSYKNNL